LKIGIFELVDNAIDFWTRGGSTSKLHIDIVLDPDRQVLSVRDDAGGVKQNDSRLRKDRGRLHEP
jgi:two-component sensor histidine kinase